MSYEITLVEEQARAFPEFAWNKPILRPAVCGVALREPSDVPRMMMKPELYERVVTASFEVGDDGKTFAPEVALVLWPNKYTHAKVRRVVMSERVHGWSLMGGWSRRVHMENMLRRLFSENKQ